MFGNEGTEYDEALVFWDHSTETTWSQITGMGLEGPLAGVELALIPAPLTTWGDWQSEHPDSLVLVDPA